MDKSVCSGSRILRKEDEIYLVGRIEEKILGSKLPSNRQVLSVFLFKKKRLNKTLQESANLLFDEISVFWGKARIPIRRKSHCVEKMLNLYGTWLSFKKSISRQSETEKQKREKFIEEMDNLFDIAHNDALNMINNEEDKLFLISQRKKGRVGIMQGIDRTLTGVEKRREERESLERKRRERSEAEIKNLGKLLIGLIMKSKIISCLIL